MDVSDIEALADEASEPAPLTHCDQCGNIMDPGERITTYASTQDYNHDHLPPEDRPALWMQRTFCEGCDRDELFMSHRGTLEILYATRLDEDRRRIPDHEVVDYSPRHAGVEYDPIETWECVAQVPFAHMLKRWAHAGPGDIPNQLAAAGIDLRRYVSDDGRRLDLGEEEARELHETYRASLENRNTPASDEWEEMKTEMAALGKRPPDEA